MSYLAEVLEAQRTARGPAGVPLDFGSPLPVPLPVPVPEKRIPMGHGQGQGHGHGEGIAKIQKGIRRVLLGGFRPASGMAGGK